MEALKKAMENFIKAMEVLVEATNQTKSLEMWYYEKEKI